MPHNKFRFPKSMRFNKQELITLASQPSQKFDKEGILIIKEKQDGFFRRTESIKVEQVTKPPKEGKRETLRSLSCVGVTGKVSLERWCRLRGNLLFYLRGPEQWSEPLGAIVLEQCTVRAAPQDQCGHWPFQIVWDGGLCYKMAAITESDRVGWLQAIQLATYECMKSQMLALQERLEKRRGPDPDMDIHMWRIQRGQTMDISEVPLCELSLSCDNLLCDAHGRPPSPLLVIHVKSQSGHWIRYAATEVMETSSNPSYLSTVSFRASDGLNGDTLIRVTAYDMRERVSQTAVPMGFATVLLSTIQDTQRLRIALCNRENQTVGFLTLNGWSLEPSTQNASPNHCIQNGTNGPASMDTPQKKHSHRRSQSLPPRLGVKLKLPSHGTMLKQVCANVHQVTYRFHSGLGGDITVHELMAESKLCFNMPQQLLGIFIQREKELLQEVICMGELGGSWKARQMELLDTHLSLLKHYSHARQSLQMFLQATNGKYFKESSRKGDINLEFAPVNLHLQRMWVHNDTLNKSGFYDLVTVGAFTAHSHKAGKSGGLIRLVQQLKDIPTTRTSLNCPSASRVQMACDAVQAIKQLRGEVVNIMRKLLSLAKCKQSTGMMPLAEEMITKTRILLSLWDPGLVEEALSFIDTHKVAQVVHDDADLDVGSAGRNKKRPQILSPFKRLTEQLSMLDLKSPELEDFATPSTPSNNTAIWPTHDSKISSSVPNVNKMLNSFQNFDNQKNPGDKTKDHESELKFYNDHFKNEANTLAGLNDFHSMTFHKTEPDNSPIHIPISGLYSRSNDGSDSKESSKSSPIMVQKNRSDPSSLKLEDGFSLENTGSVSSLKLGRNEGSFEEHCEVFPLSLEDHGSSISANSDEVCQWKESMIDPQELSLCSDNVIRQFLDVAAMANSPSANYYQPTDEPEPWDLTQLNVEASVMCLVSKVKFLCGRCGSPAVRLRGQRANIPGTNKNNLKLSLRGHISDKNVVTNQPMIGYINSIQPNAESEETKCLLQTKRETQSSDRTGRTEDNALNSAKARRNAAIDADQALNNAVDSVQKVVKKGNKFTDGLTLSELSDWASELRPAMRKLRQAMDGLLKSGRLAHAVLRLRGETAQRARAAAALQIRRDTCFSQALTAVTTGLLCWLWSTDPEIVSELLKAGLGPLCCLEGLLSLYGNEVAMWGDMVVAIEDLQTVLFTLSRWNHSSTTLAPQVTGSRGSLNVTLPVLDSLYSTFPTKQPITFTLTAVFFNVGINEKATVAEALGETVPQDRSNSDNFDRLNKYYHKYKKIIIPSNSANVTRASSKVRPLDDVMENLRIAIQKKVPKNVDILQLASNACRQMNGIRVTSCKSAKDRTAMSCTLEQGMILSNEYHLAEHEFSKALDCMRSEGCRRENTYKNTGVRKYAFNKVQLMALPKLYRPPPGTYGSVQT